MINPLPLYWIRLFCCAINDTMCGVPIDVSMHIFKFAWKKLSGNNKSPQKRHLRCLWAWNLDLLEWKQMKKYGHFWSHDWAAVSASIKNKMSISHDTTPLKQKKIWGPLFVVLFFCESQIYWLCLFIPLHCFCFQLANTEPLILVIKAMLRILHCCPMNTIWSLVYRF